MQEWMTVEQVAERLRLSIRQATRYAERDDVETQREGRRIMFRTHDIEAIATTIGVETRPVPPARPEMIPAGEMLQTFERQQGTIASLERERGRLEGLLESVGQQLTDTQSIRDDLAVTRAELGAARDEMQKLREYIEAQQKRPWWQRWRDDNSRLDK